MLIINIMLTRDLDIIKTNLTVYFARLSNKILLTSRFGTDKCLTDLEMAQELLLYQWLLFYWSQYEDGTPVTDNNYITQQDFDIMINRVQFLIET